MHNAGMMFACHKAGWIAGWLLASTLVAPAQAAQTGSSDAEATTFEALRQADLQLATIGFRLSTANAPLCDRLEPGTGLQLHTLAQYAPGARDRVRSHFGFEGPVAVEGVVPGSPAERAGVKSNDTLLAIDGVPLGTAPAGEASTEQLATIHTRFAALSPTAPLTVSISRAGKRMAIRIQPIAACFSRYELRIGNDFDARANGELVQITSKYLETIPNELLPAVIAHELSHNILRHRERLKAVGAEFGMASGFGRNVGYFRQTEIEADILAVHLLARAGYSTSIAARFWREAGPRIMAGMIRSRSHPPLTDRVALAQVESDRLAARPDLPTPAFVAERNAVLTGDWRRYIPVKRP